jgi:hypothetical protein
MRESRCSPDLCHFVQKQCDTDIGLPLSQDDRVRSCVRRQRCVTRSDRADTGLWDSQFLSQIRMASNWLLISGQAECDSVSQRQRISPAMNGGHVSLGNSERGDNGFWQVGFRDHCKQIRGSKRQCNSTTVPYKESAGETFKAVSLKFPKKIKK